jgi:hypothetical protein
LRAHGGGSSRSIKGVKWWKDESVAGHVVSRQAQPLQDRLRALSHPSGGFVRMRWSIFGWCVCYTNGANVQCGKASCVKLCALDFSRQVIQQRHSSDMPSKDDTSDRKGTCYLPVSRRASERSSSMALWGKGNTAFDGSSAVFAEHDQEFMFVTIRTCHSFPYPCKSCI